MIQIDLNGKEHRTLLDMLEEDCSELRMEISKTDSYDYREMLKERRAVLKKVIEVLRQEGPMT